MISNLVYTMSFWMMNYFLIVNRYILLSSWELKQIFADIFILWLFLFWQLKCRVSRGECLDHINLFNRPHFWACPKLRSRIYYQYCLTFYFICFFYRLADILFIMVCWIVNHHCLLFLNNGRYSLYYGRLICPL